MYLVDTNVISEIRKAKVGKANLSVVKWASSVDSSDLFLSVISIMEIETGILLSERKDKEKAAVLKKWLHDDLIPAFKGRILPFDIKESLCCAALHVPDKRSERDAMIGATAITKKMTMVTRNISDFNFLKIKLLNPWDD